MKSDRIPNLARSWFVLVLGPVEEENLQQQKQILQKRELFRNWLKFQIFSFLSFHRDTVFNTSKELSHERKKCHMLSQSQQIKTKTEIK